jgi:mersacidin/lichenicidin family type 2 lantibiotic
MHQERNPIMSDLDIIRAWKDKTYRNSLNADQLAQLPENPAGAIELTDDELGNVDGGTTPSIIIISAWSVSAVLSWYVSWTLSYGQGTNGTALGCC